MNYKIQSSVITLNSMCNIQYSIEFAVKNMYNINGQLYGPPLAAQAPIPFVCLLSSDELIESEVGDFPVIPSLVQERQLSFSFLGG